MPNIKHHLKMSNQKKIDNQVLVIFGASGDLTARKLLPEIFHLFCKGYLPEKYAILGVGRSPFSDESYRQEAVLENPHFSSVKDIDNNLKKFAALVHYVSLDTGKEAAYAGLKEKLTNILPDTLDPNIIFYLSTPPKLYIMIANSLAAHGMNLEDGGWKRVIVEKPFGYDLATAQQLNKELLKKFKEDQIYRIDHYLGKETVQNLMVTRFSNSIFEPLWNRNYIHRIEITAAENVGVGNRGGYYEGAGAMRDMIQNHLLQLLSLVAMEPPSHMTPNAIRNEKDKLFQSLRPMSLEDISNNVIRGQYTSTKINDEVILGYREEQGVSATSRTETFAALKFYVDNWRWADVPFYIRTGKRLPTRVSEVVIHFKPNHLHLFKDMRMINAQNVLIFRIQPNEGILLKFGLKVPGTSNMVKTVNMDFQYDDLTEDYVPDPYERLILDCMQGDATLYSRGDSVENSWQFIDPILRAWENDPEIPIYGYPAGTWGPEHMDTLIEGTNMVWRNPSKNLSHDGEYCEL